MEMKRKTLLKFIDRSLVEIVLNNLFFCNGSYFEK